MTRVLAELMGAAEPAFRQQVQRLEQAAGLPAADIRLMMRIVTETRAKIRDLGLDPHDTTGRELYAALQERLRADELRIQAALGLAETATSLEVMHAVKKFFDRLAVASDSFAIKPVVMRRLLKQQQPKATMKRLGYRSMDSMLKHEPVAQLLAATQLSESADWQKRLNDRYQTLTAADFESRRVQFVVPVAKQWQQVAQAYTESQKHTMLPVSELATIVLLPMARALPALAVTNLVLGMQALNDLRSHGSYLKLQQVRPDFGRVFQQSLIQEPMTEAELAGQRLPWRTIQWFYGHGHSPYHPDVFEPHVQPDDLTWHDAETVLPNLHEALSFWQGSQLLGLLDGTQAVSLNLLDVALGVTNGLSYGERLVHNMRQALSHELLASYLHQDNLQALMVGGLSRQLVPEPTFEA